MSVTNKTYSDAVARITELETTAGALLALAFELLNYEAAQFDALPNRDGSLKATDIRGSVTTDWLCQFRQRVRDVVKPYTLIGRAAADSLGDDVIEHFPTLEAAQAQAASLLQIDAFRTWHDDWYITHASTGRKYQGSFDNDTKLIWSEKT